MAVTAFVNQKGGVGKTTVTLGLASAVAADGRRVLVVDLDPQSNATTGLGVWDVESSTAEVLEHEAQGSARAALRSAGWDLSDGAGSVDVVASSPRLAQREHHLAMDVIGAQDRLDQALSGITDDYDEVLIDCPPSLGLLSVNALFAADRVVIVAEPAAWSSDGVDQILRNVRRISERRGGRPAVAGIAINRLGRTRDAAYWHAQMAETHEGLLLDPPTRLRAVVAEAAAQSIPLHQMTRDGSSEAIEEFSALARSLAMLGPRTPASADTESADTESADTESANAPAAPTETATPTTTEPIEAEPVTAAPRFDTTTGET